MMRIAVTNDISIGLRGDGQWPGRRTASPNYRFTFSLYPRRGDSEHK